MIVEVKAKFACDDCGTEFLVSLDPAYAPSIRGWTIFSVAEDAIRAGFGYEDGYDDEEPGATGSVQDTRHYCGRCTRKRDRADESVDV